MKLSVVIPVFRGKSLLPELFQKINETLEGKFDFEVLFICDGCDPESENYVRCIAEEHKSNTSFYKFHRNYGQQQALHFGLGRVMGDLIITMDEDLQHKPSDILKLVDKQFEGDYDVVYGRLNYRGEKRYKNFPAKIFRRILHFLIPSLNRQYSPFRLITKGIAHNISKIDHFFPVIDCHIGDLTEKIAFVPLYKHYRPEGKSSYSLQKLLDLGFLMLISHTGFLKYMYITGASLIASGILIFCKAPGYYSMEVFSDASIISGSILLIIAVYGTIVKRAREKNRAVILYD